MGGSLLPVFGDNLSHAHMRLSSAFPFMSSICDASSNDAVWPCYSQRSGLSVYSMAIATVGLPGFSSPPLCHTLYQSHVLLKCPCISPLVPTQIRAASRLYELSALSCSPCPDQSVCSWPPSRIPDASSPLTITKSIGLSVGLCQRTKYIPS